MKFLMAYSSLFIVTLLVPYPTVQHFIWPLHWCLLADICNHTYIPECGTENALDMYNRRLFIDECDMFEYNCDYEADYYPINYSSCFNIPPTPCPPIPPCPSIPTCPDHRFHSVGQLIMVNKKYNPKSSRKMPQSKTTPPSVMPQTKTTPLSEMPQTKTTTSSEKPQTKTTPLSEMPQTKTTTSSEKPQTKTTPPSEMLQTKTTTSSEKPQTKTTTPSEMLQTKTTTSSETPPTETTTPTYNDPEYAANTNRTLNLMSYSPSFRKKKRKTTRQLTKPRSVRKTIKKTAPTTTRTKILKKITVKKNGRVFLKIIKAIIRQNPNKKKVRDSEFLE